MSSSPANLDLPTPGVLRRMASVVYECLLLFAVAFAGAWLFLYVSGGREVLGWLRYALQGYLGAVYAAYFLWCWLRGGQTLAMKTWRIRLVVPGLARVPPARALIRFVYAALLVGGFLVTLGAAFKYRDPWLALLALSVAGAAWGWAFLDRDRQFLYDRLAGTRLVLVPRAKRP